MDVRKPAFAIALGALLAGAVAAQTLYRWTDADGKVHYTDSPPPSSAKEARTVTTDAAADQRAADALREQNAAIAKRAAERNKTPDEREREKKDAERKTRCGALMNIVNAFDRGDPIFRESEKGKQELKGADREIERLRNTQQFQLECQDLANNASAAAAARVAGSPAGAANRPGAAATGGVGAGSNAAGGASTAGGRSASPSGKPGSTATPSGR